MRKVVQVTVLSGHCLELHFDDGVSGTVDLSDLAGHGVFVLWQDRGAFEQVRIGASGELAWGEQVDLCPDALYLRLTGKQPEDIFPSLRREAAHA